MWNDLWCKSPDDTKFNRLGSSVIKARNLLSTLTSSTYKDVNLDKFKYKGFIVRQKVWCLLKRYVTTMIKEIKNCKQNISRYIKFIENYFDQNRSLGRMYTPCQLKQRMLHFIWNDGFDSNILFWYIKNLDLDLDLGQIPNTWKQSPTMRIIRSAIIWLIF